MIEDASASSGRARGNVRIWDVSQPVSPRTAVFPGDEPFSCGWTGRLAQGESVNLGWTRSTTHAGTHVDAPFHVDDAGAKVGALDPATFVGPCVVVDATGRSALDEALLSGVDLDGAPRVLFRTAARDEPSEFRRDFPVLTPGAVDLLGASGVRLVGVDAPSVDRVDAKRLEVHHALVRRGIVNVENLALASVQPGRYELLAAPVRWVDMDAAPLRALLRR